MTTDYFTPEPQQYAPRVFFIVHPGPCIRVFADGKQVIEAALSTQETIALIGDLAKQVKA
jgi:TATA-box binding protein (TBP) (component of TFIID and TFIIIB)